MQAKAAHVLSLFSPWLEAQHDVPSPEYWVGFMPYLLVEAMRSEKTDDEQRTRIKRLLDMHLSPRGRALTGNLVRELLLNGLKSDSASLTSGASEQQGAQPSETFPSQPQDDATLALWVRRARSMMADMDWWAVQNRIWERGLKNYPLLAKELGFR